MEDEIKQLKEKIERLTELLLLNIKCVENMLEKQNNPKIKIKREDYDTHYYGSSDYGFRYH